MKKVLPVLMFFVLLVQISCAVVNERDEPVMTPSQSHPPEEVYLEFERVADGPLADLFGEVDVQVARQENGDSSCYIFQWDVGQFGDRISNDADPQKLIGTKPLLVVYLDEAYLENGTWVYHTGGISLGSSPKKFCPKGEGRIELMIRSPRTEGTIYFYGEQIR